VAAPLQKEWATIHKKTRRFSMGEANDELVGANKVAALWLQGKTLADIAITYFGHRVTLAFRPEGANLPNYSDIRLKILQDWSVKDTTNPPVLTNLSRQLEEELDKQIYITECVSHAPDIIRLFLMVGSVDVECVQIGADASLIVRLSNGVEIHVAGCPASPDIYDEEAWSLEVESVKEGSPFALNYSARIFVNEDGQLDGDTDPSGHRQPIMDEKKLGLAPH
jgi:hypothetical protein